MRAMVLTAPGELVQDEVARPARRPATCSCALRTAASAAPTTRSSTDRSRSVIRGSWAMRWPAKSWRRAASLRAGDMVIVDPELYCGACFHCRIGKTHLCPNGLLLGRDANGGFAEWHLAAPATHVFKLPDEIDRRAAPMIQVLTTCLHAQRQIDIFPWRIRRRARAWRNRTAARTAREGTRRDGDWGDAKCRQACTRRDARRRYDVPGDADAVAKVREATEGRGPDVVIETTGVYSSLPQPST